MPAAVAVAERVLQCETKQAFIKKAPMLRELVTACLGKQI